MEERYGVRGTVAGDIFFTESGIPSVRVIRHINVEISRQNADLWQVKEKMAAEAMRVGANAITNFRYGQKKHPWWQLLMLKWDTESWHGEGDAVQA